MHKKRLWVISYTFLLTCWAGSAIAADLAQLPTETREAHRVIYPDGHLGWRIVSVPLPQIGDHDVLVHVRAVALQGGDADTNNSKDAQLVSDEGRKARVGGTNAAGVIVRVGRLVTDFKVGQKVVSMVWANYTGPPLTRAKQCLRGMCANGVYGDYVALEDTGIAPMPQWLSFEEASTLPTAALVAWSALRIDRNGLHKADTVVIEGTGGISTFALQFAVAVGARAIVTSDSDEKLAWAKAHGAWGGINYKKVPTWSESVLTLTGGRGADLVLDMGGRCTIDQSTKSVAYEGTVDLVGGLCNYDAQVSTYALLWKGAIARGIMIGSRADFMHMCRFMEQHKIHPISAETLPFDDFDKGLAEMRSGKQVGKVVLLL